MSVLGTDKRDSSFHATKNPQDSQESTLTERDVSASVSRQDFATLNIYAYTNNSEYLKC